MKIYSKRHSIPRRITKWQALALTLPTGGGRSVGMIRSRTQTTEISLVSTKTFKCCPKCSLPILSLFPYCICATLSAHRISPHALYGYCESYGIHFHTLGRILLDIFMIIFEIFVTINTPVGARGSLVVKALCYKAEGRWFETRTNEIFIYFSLNLRNTFGRTRQWASLSI
jgi:hypothetical protein